MHRLRWMICSEVVVAFVILMCVAGCASAVPAFARQTGQECPACHVSWPELTPYGRYFKLTGYTIGKSFWAADKPYVPAAVMAQASISSVKNNNAVDPTTGETTPV